MHHQDIRGRLATDHTLLKDCATALNVPDELLSQQFKDLKETIATVLKEQTENGREEVDGEVSGGGGGDIEEDVESGVGGVKRHGDEIQEEVEDLRSEISTLPDQGGMSLVTREEEVQRSDEKAGGDAVLAPAWSEEIEEDPNFPRGQVLYTTNALCHQEPDLDSLEMMEDSVANSNKLEAPSDHWTEEPLPESSETPPPLNVARSQSKSIPQAAPPTSSISLESSPIDGSAASSLTGTPSTSREGSLRASWSRDALVDTMNSQRDEIKEGQKGIIREGQADQEGMAKEGQEVIDKEALAMRVRQMALLVASTQEDVVAVPSRGSNSR